MSAETDPPAEVDPPAEPDPGGLTPEAQAMLEFERDWPSTRAGKDEAVRSQFSMSPARYYQVLGSVIRTEAALKFDPLLVKRLIRQREERRRSRELRISPTPRS